MAPPLLLLLLACSPAPETGSPPLPDTGLDPSEDADGDGIDNATELAEGSDPRDPSSASAWHPEWTERPRLLTNPAGLERIPELRARDGEPWESLSARITSRCAGDPMEDDPTLVSATVNGNIALACALEHLAGDPEAGAKAAGILESLPVTAELDAETLFYTDLHASQGLLQGARAYDLLLAAGYPSGRDPADAHARLHALGDFLWDYYVERYPQWMGYAQNNHATKLAAAFGALGMGAPDDPRAARYVNYAVGELHRLRPLLFAEDGGYAEGPGYLVYAMESELPFMAAFDRWLGDGSVPVATLCAHDLDPACEPGLELLGSPLRDPAVCASFERFVEQLMPAGYGPNTDDSNLASAHLGLVAGLCDAPTAAWGWAFQASSWASAGSVDVTADTLLAWDLAPEPAAPEPGPLARPDAGWAVLRSGWERDSAYALLLAEHGVARSGGGGHEHPDALAYLWAAGGDYLLIDAGYGSWAEHTEVNDAEAHNLFLVGGEGPGDADAWIDHAVTSGAHQRATGHTSYAGLDWTRHITLVGEDVLVVLDQVEPSHGGGLALALQTQGPGTGLEIDGPLARWPVGERELQVMVVADRKLDLSVRGEEHAFSYSDYQPHDALEASLTVDGPTRWLTVARVGLPGADDGLQAAEQGVSWPGGGAALDGTVSD